MISKSSCCFSFGFIVSTEDSSGRVTAKSIRDSLSFLKTSSEFLRHNVTRWLSIWVSQHINAIAFKRSEQQEKLLLKCTDSTWDWYGILWRIMTSTTQGGILESVYSLHHHSGKPSSIKFVIIFSPVISQIMMYLQKCD